jgi:hypothetical protein
MSTAQETGKHSSKHLSWKKGGEAGPRPITQFSGIITEFKVVAGKHETKLRCFSMQAMCNCTHHTHMKLASPDF